MDFGRQLKGQVAPAYKLSLIGMLMAGLAMAPGPCDARSIKKAKSGMHRASPSGPVARPQAQFGPAAIRAANAQALAHSRADGFVHAAQVFTYEQGRVYEVWTAPMRITTVSLEPGEAIINKAAGDTQRWMIGDTTSGAGSTRQTHILVKPYKAGLATNMVVTTNRRVYLLSLRAAPSADAFNAAVTWTHDLPQALAQTKSGKQAQMAAAPLAGPASNPASATASAAASASKTTPAAAARYRIRTGWHKPAWTPVSVHDDGRQTFITFPAGLTVTEAPPLFVLGDGGAAQLTNWRKQGHVYVVDRLFEKAELRLGGDKPRVVRIERKGDVS